MSLVNGNVKVWNDNTHDFTQNFKGETKHIKAGSYIEMDYWEAKSFLGKISPVVVDAAGKPKPESYKKLRIEGKPQAFETVQAFMCHADGTLHKSQAALEEHIRYTIGADRMADDGAKEALIKKKPGRPAKQQEAHAE
jgi:hypothetical protein